MADDDDGNVTIFPTPKRGRPRSAPMLEEAQGSERESLAAFWKNRIQELERAHQERVELLRTVGEHPSPIFQRIVRMDGALGMPKNIVAKKLGMSTHSLELHYGNDYDMGEADIIASVAANAIRIATSTTDPNAGRLAVQVLDRRGGAEWKPPAQRIETKTDDAPPTIDSSKLTPDERAQLRAMIERQIAMQGDGQTEGDATAE